MVLSARSHTSELHLPFILMRNHQFTLLFLVDSRRIISSALIIIGWQCVRQQVLHLLNFLLLQTLASQYSVNTESSVLYLLTASLESQASSAIKFLVNCYKILMTPAAPKLAQCFQFSLTNELTHL